MNATTNQTTEAQVEDTTQATPETEAAKPTKAKRVILNPQPKIDAKVALVAEAGGSIEWKGRLWVVKLDGKTLVMDSHEFAAFATPEELLMTMGSFDWTSDLPDSIGEEPEAEAEEVDADEAADEEAEEEVAAE